MAKDTHEKIEMQEYHLKDKALLDDSGTDELSDALIELRDLLQKLYNLSKDRLTYNMKLNLYNASLGLHNAFLRFTNIRENVSAQFYTAYKDLSVFLKDLKLQLQLQKGSFIKSYDSYMDKIENFFIKLKDKTLKFFKRDFYSEIVTNIKEKVNALSEALQVVIDELRENAESEYSESSTVINMELEHFFGLDKDSGEELFKEDSKEELSKRDSGLAEEGSSEKNPSENLSYVDSVTVSDFKSAHSDLGR